MEHSRLNILAALTAILSIEVSGSTLLATPSVSAGSSAVPSSEAERISVASGLQDGKAGKGRGTKAPKLASGVELDGKQLAFDKLPADLPAGVQRAIALARPYCEANGGWLLLEPQQRLALVVQELDKRSRKWFELAAQTADWFDQRLPAVPSQSAPEAPGTYRTDSFTADSELALVFMLRDEAAQGVLLERIAELAPTMASSARSAGGASGFMLGRQACATVLLQVAGNEEYDAGHELVNRLAQILLERRFGTQPYWIQQGVAWCAEWRYDRQIYCFPYRDEFVLQSEHGAWQSEVRRTFGKRSKQPVTATELDACRRGRWDGDAARAAFGVADFLLSEEPARVASALEALRAWRDVDDRQRTGQYSWVRTLGYEVSAAKVEEILGQHLGADWGARATRHVASLGKR